MENNIPVRIVNTNFNWRTKRTMNYNFPVIIVNTSSNWKTILVNKSFKWRTKCYNERQFHKSIVNKNQMRDNYLLDMLWHDNSPDLFALLSFMILSTPNICFYSILRAECPKQKMSRIPFKPDFNLRSN